MPLGYNAMLHHRINWLAPGRLERNLRKVIFKLILVIGGWGIFCKIALRWMSMDLTDDKSTSVQVMAWCRQATSRYLSQCWPRSMLTYGVTRPQWVNYSFVGEHVIWFHTNFKLGYLCLKFNFQSKWICLKSKAVFWIRIARVSIVDADGLVL